MATFLGNIDENVISPLTITPVIYDNDGVEKPQTPNHHKQPDLTFHCNCCEEFFVNPFELFHHMNTHELDVAAEEEQLPLRTNLNERMSEAEFDYSCVLEPVCDIVAVAEKKKTLVIANSAEKCTIVAETESESDSDDDSSTSSSSSSTTSTSELTNTNSQSQDAESSNMDVFPHGPEMLNNETAYAPDPVSTLMMMNNMGSTTITPVLPTVKRRRGRRSAAQFIPALSKQEKCFQCVHCEASFQNAGDLSKHVRSHITNKPFQCSICEKTFTHIGSLNTHLRIHSGDKPYKCELCSKAFTQSSSLMVHLRSHTIKKPHQCHLCDKGFVNSSSLVLHLKTHSEIENFVCPECDKEFKQEDQLDEHMRMHTQELVYQCSICRNAFRTSSELVQHMKVHMGDKPFSCSICDARFTQSGSLNIHMRIHTGEKPFHCNICNKSFTQASSLSVHAKIHKPGEKPYPCHICGKAYSQQAYLNKHIQSHSEVLPKTETPPENLMCIVCGSLHPDVKSLSRHVVQHHAALLTDFKGLNNCSDTASLQHLQMLLNKEKTAACETENRVKMEYEDNEEYDEVEEQQIEYDFDYAAEEEVETAE